MPVYRIKCDLDASDHIVEADSFNEALDLWTILKKREWAEDYESGDGPTSLELLSEGPVISKASLEQDLTDPVDSDGNGRDGSTPGEFEG